MTASPARRVAWAGVLAYGVLTLVSIGAFFTMVGRPIPPGFDADRWRAGYEFGMRHFGTLIIVAGHVAAVASLAAAVGLRRALLGSTLVVAMTTAIECVGAATGFPFGEHGYGRELGWLVFGLVPFTIPLSWFLMLHASLGIALRFGRGPVATLVLSALGLFAWDVLMEPAMSAAYPFWFWRSSGVWYGMPLANWASWLVIGPAIAFALWRVAGDGLRGLARDPLPLALYALTGLLPFALALKFRLYPAAAVGGLAMLAFMVAPAAPRLARWRQARAPERRPRPAA